MRAARAPFQCGQVQLDSLISMSDQLFGLPEACAGAGHRNRDGAAAKLDGLLMNGGPEQGQ